MSSPKLKSNLSLSEKNRAVYTRYHRLYPLRRFFFEVQYKKNTFKKIFDNPLLPQSGVRVLDLGFGFGEMLRLFKKDCGLFGIDLSQCAVETALKARCWSEYSYKEFKCVDLNESKILYPNELFDIVLCSHVLEHLNNPLQVLDDVIRVLKPGGFIILISPVNDGITDSLHSSAYTRDSLDSIKRQLLDSNFVEISEYDDGYLFNIYDFFKKLGFLWIFFVIPINVLFSFELVQRVLDYLSPRVGLSSRQNSSVFRKNPQ